jgi:hypothetical protein
MDYLEVDHDLVELHRQYAAFMNPQVHFFLNLEPTYGSFLEEDDIILRERKNLFDVICERIG